jgi:hypothetical protein
MPRDNLESYRDRRNLRSSPEPEGGRRRRGRGRPRFVIQKHDASSLHYDFRLEADGALKSWAVPKGPSTEQRKDKRRGRLYLDTGRNAYAQTAVAPYAVRALAGAPIACPIDWRELGRVEPRSFTLANAQRRLARKADPWAGIRDDARPLREPGRRLERLR